MVNRKGFIRIAELLIAVSLISVVLIISYRQVLPKQETQDLAEVSRDILEEISSMENLRIEVVDNQQEVSDMVETLDFINESLPDYIQFELRACIISSACGQSNYVGDVFSAERIISSSKDDFGPVKLRLFLWVDQ